MIEKVFATAVAAGCLLLLLRLCLGERRRRRFDNAVARLWSGSRRAVRQTWRWPASRRQAARVAEEAIRRARGKVDREGNVYKPKAFRRPKKPH